jgi:hypothetical protein
MFQTKVVEKIKTHLFCPEVFFFSFENHAVNEVMWKSMMEPARPHDCIMLLRKDAL